LLRSAWAQSLRRIAVLLVTSDCPAPAALVQSLAALGWIEGRTIVFDCVSAVNRLEQLPALATALVARRPDVIVSALLPGIRALKSATTTIPIVALGVADPVGQKLVQSLARPEGNLTGLVSVMLELEEKRIELLKQVLPQMSRLAAVYRRGGEGGYYVAIDRVLERVGGIYGIKYERFYYERNEDIVRVLDEIAAKNFHAVYFPPGPLTESVPAVVARAARKNRLPVIGQGSRFAEAGALMTYSPNTAHVAERCASFVDRILRGAKPAELPFEQPTKFELILNLKTARALDLAIPQAVLLRADRLIE
jgi:putative ABC transport system substrate-binding protein